MYHIVLGICLAFLFQIDGWVVAIELLENEGRFREPEVSASESEANVTSSLRSQYNDTTVPVQVYYESSTSTTTPPVIATKEKCIDPQEFGDVVLKLLELLNLSINHEKLDLKKIDYVLDSIKKYEINDVNKNKSIETQINDLKRQLHKEEALNSKLPSRRWMVPYETLLLNTDNAGDYLRSQESITNVNEHPDLQERYLRTFTSKGATGKREIFRYELPREGDTSCKDALLNLIQVTQRAYLKLAQHPVCSQNEAPNEATTEFFFRPFPTLPTIMQGIIRSTTTNLDSMSQNHNQVHFPYDNMGRQSQTPVSVFDLKHVVRTTSNVADLERNTIKNPLKYEQAAKAVANPILRGEVNVNSLNDVQSLQSLQIPTPSLESRFSGANDRLNQYTVLNNNQMAHIANPYPVSLPAPISYPQVQSSGFSNFGSYVQNNSLPNAFPYQTSNVNVQNSFLNKLTQATLHTGSAQMSLTPRQVPDKINPTLNGLGDQNTNPIDQLLYLQKLFKPRGFTASQSRLVSGVQNFGSNSGLEQHSQGQNNIASNLNQYHQKTMTYPNQNVQTPMQYQNHLNMWYSQQNPLQLQSSAVPLQNQQNIAALNQEINRNDNKKYATNAENRPPSDYNQLVPRTLLSSSTSRFDPVLLKESTMINNNSHDSMPNTAQRMVIQSSTPKNSLSSLLQQKFINPSNGKQVNQQDSASNYFKIQKILSVDPIPGQNSAMSNSQYLNLNHLLSSNSNNLNQQQMHYQQNMISQQNPNGQMVQQTVLGVKPDIYQMLQQETLKVQMKGKSQQLSNPGAITFPGETNQGQALNQIQVSSLGLNTSLQNQDKPLDTTWPNENVVVYPEQLNVFPSQISTGQAQVSATDQNNLNSGSSNQDKPPNTIWPNENVVVYPEQLNMFPSQISTGHAEVSATNQNNLNSGSSNQDKPPNTNWPNENVVVYPEQLNVFPSQSPAGQTQVSATNQNILNSVSSNQDKPPNTNWPNENVMVYPEQLNVFPSQISTGQVQVSATNQNNLNFGSSNQDKPPNTNWPSENVVVYPEHLNVFPSQISNGQAQVSATNQNNLNSGSLNQDKPLNTIWPNENNVVYPEQLNVFPSESPAGQTQVSATNQNNLNSGPLPSVAPLVPLFPQTSQNVNVQSIHAISYPKEQPNWNPQQVVSTDQNMLALQYPQHQNNQIVRPMYPTSDGLNPFPPPQTHAEWIYQERFLNPSFDDQYKKQNGYIARNIPDSRQFGVTNGANFNKLPINADSIELTYIINRPQPMIYKPFYYVKYKIPYKSFMDDVQKIIHSKPYMRTHPDELYSEVLTAANVTETSPDLKDLTIKELQQLVTINGTLAKAKLMNQGAEVNLVDHRKTSDQNVILNQLFGAVPTNNVNNPNPLLDSYLEQKAGGSKALRSNSLPPTYLHYNLRPIDIKNINSGINEKRTGYMDRAQQYYDLDGFPQQQIRRPLEAKDYSTHIYESPEFTAPIQWKQHSRSYNPYYYHPIYINSDNLNPVVLDAFEQLKRNARFKVLAEAKKKQDSKNKLKEEKLKQLQEAQKALSGMDHLE